MSSDRPSGELFEVYTSREVRAATVWLHGLGADAENLNPILVHLRQSRELGLQYLAPSAPHRRGQDPTLPVRAWFREHSPGMDEAEQMRDLEDSTATVHRLLDHLYREGHRPDRVILAGFCQGATLALHAGLRYRHALAGIVALSGKLLLPDLPQRQGEQASLDTPLLMMHGQEDHQIPIRLARHGRDRLLELGYRVDWRDYPIGHAVSPEEVRAVDDWMVQRLGETAQAGSRRPGRLAGRQ